jgi:hypothetical protein
VEIWRVFADPTRSDFGIDKVMDGPGTQAPRSIVNVLGDLFYFSRGGFRSLKQTCSPDNSARVTSARASSR